MPVWVTAKCRTFLINTTASPANGEIIMEANKLGTSEKSNSSQAKPGINENFGNRITVEKLIMLTICTLDEIEEELANEWLKKIAKEVVMGFSSEIFITFFSEKDGTC